MLFLLIDIKRYLSKITRNYLKKKLKEDFLTVFFNMVNPEFAKDHVI